MTKERIRQLNAIGFVWNCFPKCPNALVDGDAMFVVAPTPTSIGVAKRKNIDCRWHTQYNELINFKERFGNCKFHSMPVLCDCKSVHFYKI